MDREAVEAVVKILAEYGELNISRIARLTRLHYRTVARVLDELVRRGLVEERRFGRLRLFRLKTEAGSGITS